ncbi:hypothetical protein PFISCL1PPCAC_20506, partial [Pristionchus fissidentatus]
GEENSQPSKLSLASPLPSKSLSTEPKSCDSSLDSVRPLYWSYPAMTALALIRSPTGRLTVEQIYNFISDHFPYYKTARGFWKSSVRHNLSRPSPTPGFTRVLEENKR